MRMQLTALAVKGLKGRATPYEVWDAKDAGFGVRVWPSGVKSYVAMTRVEGVKRRLTLGRVEDLTLSEAREKAESERRNLRAASAEVSRSEQGAGGTFEESVEEFVKKHCHVHNKPRTAANTAGVLRSKFVSEWRGRDLRSITRVDVNRALDKIMASGAPQMANGAQRILRKFFNWSVSRGLAHANPCQGVERPAPLVKRDRVLPIEDLARVWLSARAVSPAPAARSI